VLQDYYCNDRGVVLGPYSENEISPRLRAIEKLGGKDGDGPQVYVVKATSYLHAKNLLQAQIERDKRES
jgi:hypothetical protein